MWRFLGENAPNPLPLHPYLEQIQQSRLAAHLHGCTDSKANVVVAEQSLARPRINVSIKVDVCAKRIGSRHAVLGTQRIAVGRTKFRDLDHNTVAGIYDFRATAVGLNCELPTRTASGTCACALQGLLVGDAVELSSSRETHWTNAEDILGDGSIVAVGIVSAGRCFHLAIATSPGVGGAVLGEGGLVAFAIAAATFSASAT